MKQRKRLESLLVSRGLLAFWAVDSEGPSHNLVTTLRLAAGWRWGVSFFVDFGYLSAVSRASLILCISWFSKKKCCITKTSRMTTACLPQWCMYGTSCCVMSLFALKRFVCIIIFIILFSFVLLISVKEMRLVKQLSYRLHDAVVSLQEHPQTIQSTLEHSIKL